jgi:hypothetical protein
MDDVKAPARLPEVKTLPPGWNCRNELDSPPAVERLFRQRQHLIVGVEVVSEAEVFEVTGAKGRDAKTLNATRSRYRATLRRKIPLRSFPAPPSIRTSGSSATIMKDIADTYPL